MPECPPLLIAAPDIQMRASHVLSGAESIWVRRRIFLRGCTSADYALLSPWLRRYGYEAPQRRVVR